MAGFAFVSLAPFMLVGVLVVYKVLMRAGNRPGQGGWK